MKKYFLLIFLLIGCSHTSDTNKISIQNCKNAFVLSGYSKNHIMLFEHDNNDTNFHLVKTLEKGTYAFYDCKSKSVVAHQVLNNGNSLKEGIVVYDLRHDSKHFYELHEGFNALIEKYKHGFIYSTAKVYNQQVSSEKYGYLPPQGIFKKEDVLDRKNRYAFPEKIIEDYKNGIEWRHFRMDYFFSLDSNKNEKSYPFGMWPISERLGNNLYVYAMDFLKINLQTKKAEKLWERPDLVANTHTKKLFLPKKSIKLFVNGIFYLVTSNKSWDTAYGRGNTVLERFEPGTIYQIKKKKLSRLLKLPYKDIVYANSPDKKNLYIFTKSRKVIKYDIAKRKIASIHDIPVKLDKKYELRTVGFTEKNFIISFENDKYYDAYVMVAKRDFSKISEPYHIKMGGINITTEKSVTTNHMRANNL